ncbi:MAG: DUF222 domain-containing protein [Propionibacteriaceae bacterium]
MSTTPDTLDRDGDLDLIEAALDRMMAVDNWQLSGDHLLTTMDRLGVIGERIHGIRLRTIRAVDDRRVCEDLGSYATSDRITLTDRTIPKTAKSHVKTAKDLRRFPLLQAAAEQGQLTREQLTAILLGLRWVPDTASDEQLEAIQSELLASAEVQPPSGMRRLANKLIAVHFPDVEDDRLAKQLKRAEREARRNRYFTWGLDGEGSFFFRGKLPELDGEKLVNVLTAYAYTAKGLDHRIDPEGEKPTAAQRYADALVAMVEELLRREAAPATGGDRPNVSILMGFDDLVNGTGAATLANSGAQVSPETVRHQACDANLIPIVLGKAGEVLDVGRTQRLVTPGIRKGLVVRDQGCVFPGCDAGPNRCDAHHILPWWAWGETKLENLALMCRHHHRIIEPDPRAGPGEQWTISVTAGGIPEIRPPTRIDPNQRRWRNSRFTR